MLAEEHDNEMDMSPLPEKRNDGSDDELQYGWLTIRPKKAQFLNRPVGFLVLVAMCCGPQIIIMGLLPIVQMSLTVRFNLSEKDMNVLMIVQGISAIISVIVVGYLGSFHHKIRWITAGMVLTGLGSILFAIPHFIISNYEPLDLPPIALKSFGLCTLSGFPCEKKAIKGSYMALFVIGQILIGAGVGPLYSLVPAYIDENVRLQSMPIHIMVWYLNLLLGPIISFMAGSFFLQFYVDINQPKLMAKMTPEDMRWIGAWWLPYLLLGLMVIVNAPNILGFPQRLPGSRAACIENMQEGNIPANDPKIETAPSGIIYATSSLLKNKTYIFNTLALCCTVFYVAAVGPFLIRVIMIKYGADPKKIGLAFGIVLLLGSIGGILLGGFLVKRIGLKALAKRAAFICLIVEAVCLLTPLLFVIPGCNESNIAGVSKPYPPFGKQAVLMQRGSSELTASCNAHCNCTTVISKPICGSNNVAYFDACHAGCIARPSEKNFANCSCIPATKRGHSGGEAKLGFCHRGCKSWAFFLVVMFFVLVMLGTNAVPSTIVVLRCVAHNQRSYALSLQAALALITGFIPSHLIHYIMAEDCNIWQTDPCGRKGICWDYKANSMAKSIAIFGFVVTALSMTFYFLSWYYYKQPQFTRNGRLLSDTNENNENDYEDSKETNL